MKCYYILPVSALTCACEAVARVLWSKVPSAYKQLGDIPCMLAAKQFAPAGEQSGYQPHWLGEDKDREKTALLSLSKALSSYLVPP